MSKMEHAIQAMGRLAGGSTAVSGTFINMRTGAVHQQTSQGALPALDWWHQVPSTSGSATLSTVATNLNTALNGVGGGYAYVAGDLHAYDTPDLPTSKGTGAQDA